MTTAEERRWEYLQQALLAESQGREVHVSSGKTLFGIKSHVDEVIERTVAEEEARLAAAADTAEEEARRPGPSAKQNSCSEALSPHAI